MASRFHFRFWEDVAKDRMESIRLMEICLREATSRSLSMIEVGRKVFSVSFTGILYRYTFTLSTFLVLASGILQHVSRYVRGR